MDALWIGLGSEWKFLHSGDQFTKSAEVGTKPAIAILPFLNQSDDSAREYFADGLTQDIINGLGRFSALTVMSWNAAFPYKAKPASPQEIGRGLATASGGNHGLGVAYAGWLAGARVTIYLPQNAPPAKAEKLRRNNLQRLARTRGLELRHSAYGYSLIDTARKPIDARNNMTLDEIESWLQRG